ncbi:hypothetical protein Hgul01_05054 [Herpetosiphon gulosus]|uniref:DUF4145 domain-containing protein n=2 Tax=Herpetosiphon gulosus TaxID=1973496 RepID=A0ABP9X788_9CHLR
MVIIVLGYSNRLKHAMLRLDVKILGLGLLAGIALETSLKDLCDREGIAHAKLDKMNADLAKTGIYNSVMQKQITAWAGLRNAAAHGNWGEYSHDQVKTMIAGVTQFIANHL